MTCAISRLCVKLGSAGWSLRSLPKSAAFVFNPSPVESSDEKTSRPVISLILKAQMTDSSNACVTKQVLESSFHRRCSSFACVGEAEGSPEDCGHSEKYGVKATTKAMEEKTI